MSAWIAALQEDAILWIWEMDAGHDPVERHSASAHSAEELVQTVKDLLPDAKGPIVACGLRDAGFRAVPCTPLDETVAILPTQPQLAAVPGLSQNKPIHVTLGAETRIAGFLSLNPGFDGVLCLPAAETVWAHISAGEVVSFQGFITVDLARDAAARFGLRAEAWDEPEFQMTLSDVQARPERLAGKLASEKAEALLHGLSENTARARLWGAFIGAEMAATRAYWLGQQVAVIGDGAVAQIYLSALRAQGLEPVQASGTAMLLKGLTQARARVG